MRTTITNDWYQEILKFEVLLEAAKAIVERIRRQKETHQEEEVIQKETH